MFELIKLERNFMFCDIFNQERNVSKLEKFVSVYFDIDYNLVHNNLELVPRNLPKDKKNEAWKEVDLLLRLPVSMLHINFEINNKNVEGIRDRNLMYLCKISSANYKEGDKYYKNIWTSRQINFNVNEEDDKLIKEYLLTEKEDNDVYSNKMQIDVINVANIDKVCYNSLNEREKMVYNFCRLLTTTSEEEFREVSGLMMNEEESNDLLNQVKEKSKEDEYVYMESAFRNQADYEEALREYERERAKKEVLAEGRAEGLEEGRAQGLQEGRVQGLEEGKNEGLTLGIEQEKIETAKRMLEDDLDIQTISKYTTLSESEILKLKNPE